MSRFLILLGGDLVRTPRLDSQIAGARVIAADGGIRHAGMLDVVPELWAGDFDSVPEGLDEAWASIPREIFPSEKDRTDGELAVEAAMARDATSFVLAGAFGGPPAAHAALHLAPARKPSEPGFSTHL